MMSFSSQALKTAISTALSIFIALLLLSTTTYAAQVSVEEEDSSSSSSSSSITNMNPEQRISKLERQIENQVNLLKQIDTMSQQIKELQGQIEIQAHDIKILKDQQKSQYSDLDARLNTFSHKTSQECSDSAKNDKKAETSTKNTAKTDSLTVPADDNKDEKAQKAYQAAYTLLKNKNYDKAKIAFQKFIRTYPKDTNIIEARYWLGNIYLLKNQPGNAISQFKIVLKTDKLHAKTADTLFKLGLAYLIQGNSQEASTQFKKVKQSYPSTQSAKLATEKLKELNEGKK